ncbi:MAG: superinfection exclusion B family protein [Acidobacteria bacterium]|nr:superinfection exclusion B family protein [Acidobacteriota bacterium]
MSLAWIVHEVQGASWRRRNKRTVRAEMQSLDGNEIAVLREFLLQGQNTLQMPIDDPVVAGLLSRGILEQVGQLGHQSRIGIMMSVTISSTVRDMVTPRFVGWSEGGPTREQLKEDLENRPDFFRTHGSI